MRSKPASLLGPAIAWENPLPLIAPRSHLFGVCLLNDWSARDIQAWEYQPLGPFLAKSFATTISPWVVTMEALAPFRTPAFARPPEDPPPLAYLHSEQDRQEGGIDLTLEVYLRSATDARSSPRSGSPQPQQPTRAVLDGRPVADPSCEQWLQSSAW